MGATKSHSIDLRVWIGLVPHGIPVPADNQPVTNPLGRHDFAPRGPFQQPLLERLPVPSQGGDRLDLRPAHEPRLRPAVWRHCHRALSPVSPVLIRTTELRSDTKILPSPTLPVFALRVMASITFAT